GNRFRGKVVAEHFSTADPADTSAARDLEAGDKPKLASSPQAFATLLYGVSDSICAAVYVGSEALGRGLENGHELRAVPLSVGDPGEPHRRVRGDDVRCRNRDGDDGQRLFALREERDQWGAGRRENEIELGCERR
ncbi:unnamed protein product, partial [Mycena citricolor]